METKSDESVQRARMWGSARLMVVVEGTFLFFILYLLRINFSVALVCMTDVSHATTSDNLTYHNRSATTGPSTEISPVSMSTLPVDMSSVCDSNQQDPNFKKQGEFIWGKDLRGLMLSAFFWGYVITQIPGGWFATHFGSKHVLGTGMLISILANVLIPVCSRINPYLVIALRFIMGIGHGVVFPAMHALWGKWAPPLERSKLIASTYAGTILGTIAAMTTSGYLCEVPLDHGWPLIFYIHGVIGVVWWILWNILIYDSPSKHPRISEKERVYIESSIGKSAFKKKFPVPWRSIMMSGPVWAIIIAHFANNWGSYTILTSVPTYMKEVLHFDIKANGVLSAVPYACMYVAAMFVGQLADCLRFKKILSTTRVRKLSQTFGFLVPSAFMIAVGFVDCEHRYTAVAFLTIAVTFTAFGRVAYSINHVDIAPRFSGILFGITNTVATIPGMVSPYVAAAITKNETQAEWQRVFYICGAVYASGWVAYTLLASGEEQSWAKVDSTDELELKVEVSKPLKENTSHKS